jgi:hypothetical protein
MAKQRRPQQQRKRIPGCALFAFYANSLPLLYKSNTNLRLYLVPVLHRGRYWYRLEMETTPGGERGALTTVRNKVRLWQSLNRAVEFVREMLPELDQLTVTLVGEKKVAKGKGGK